MSAAFVVAVFEGAITDVDDDDDDNDDDDDDDVVVVVVVVVSVGTVRRRHSFCVFAIFRSKFRRRFAVFQESLALDQRQSRGNDHPRMLIQI